MSELLVQDDVKTTTARLGKHIKTPETEVVLRLCAVDAVTPAFSKLCKSSFGHLWQNFNAIQSQHTWLPTRAAVQDYRVVQNAAPCLVIRGKHFGYCIPQLCIRKWWGNCYCGVHYLRPVFAAVVPLAVVCYVIECSHIYLGLSITREFLFLDRQCLWITKKYGCTKTRTKTPGKSTYYSTSHSSVNISCTVSLLCASSYSIIPLVGRTVFAAEILQKDARRQMWKWNVQKNSYGELLMVQITSMGE